MTLDPSWDDETARLFVRRDPKAQVLIVRVLDEDLGKPGDLLGVVRVPLADVVARAASTPLNALKISIAQTQEMTLDIPEGDGAPGGGTLTLRLRYLPFNPPAAAAVAAGMKRAAKGLKRDAARATDDERRALAARLAAKAAGAVAGGIPRWSRRRRLAAGSKISCGPCDLTATGPCSPPRGNSAFVAATQHRVREDVFRGERNHGHPGGGVAMRAG